MRDIAAVSFDFYNTLVGHRRGRGRGGELMDYLSANALPSDPWEHAVLYDVFARHGREYDPHASRAQHQAFCVRVAETLFQRMNVRASLGAVATHAEALWQILGPDAFIVFLDVTNTLTMLRERGYRLMIVSNWQCGLDRFCAKLGFAEHFEHIVASAEAGFAKPDARIFANACGRMGLEPGRVLHVGDTPSEDYEGARAAGMSALVLQRSGAADATAGTISGLHQVLTTLIAD